MTREDKIREMVELQIELNKITNGDKWLEGITREGAIINWGRCIYMETAELIDSFPWKHWKDINAAPDIENIKMELVDIWHFIISSQIELHYKRGEENYIEKAIEYLTEASQIEQDEDTEESTIHLHLENLRQPMLDKSEYLESIEMLMSLGIMLSGGYSNAGQYVTSANIIPKIFFIILNELGFAFDDLYKMYIVKNILNIFRQKHGYAEGKYIKIWNGCEDNEVLMRIVNNSGEITKDTLLLELEKEYMKIKGS